MRSGGYSLNVKYIFKNQLFFSHNFFFTSIFRFAILKKKKKKMNRCVLTPEL